MIAALDSSYAKPTTAQAQQAKAAGVRVWSGYLTTKPGVRIAAPWTKADFDNARLCGGTPLAYCSGWDDPVACKNLAAQWNVRLCLDVESSIRGDGSWVQAWLDASGAGLYGNPPVFAGRRAPFFVMAAYPGSNPHATWSGAPPSVPHGWQWQGSHIEFGCGVDSTWFDDWFGGDAMAGEAQAAVRLAYETAQVILNSGGMTQAQMDYGVSTINAAGGNVDAGIGTIMDKSAEWGQVRQLMTELRGLLNRVAALEAKAAAGGATVAQVESDIAKKLGG